jgi:hypothetical protein
MMSVCIVHTLRLDARIRQHNRVYDGRAIRVQLRDNQPHRFGWKFRGRGCSFYLDSIFP